MQGRQYTTKYNNKMLRVDHFNFKEYVNLLLDISQFYLKLLYFLCISKLIDDRIHVLKGRTRSGKTMITVTNYTQDGSTMASKHFHLHLGMGSSSHYLNTPMEVV